MSSRQQIIDQLEERFPGLVDSQVVHQIIKDSRDKKTAMQKSLEYYQDLVHREKTTMQALRLHPALNQALFKVIVKKQDSLEQNYRNYSRIYQADKKYFDRYHFKEYYDESQIKLDTVDIPLITYYEKILNQNRILHNFCNRVLSGNYTSKINPDTGFFYQNYKKSRSTFLTDIQDFIDEVQKLKKYRLDLAIYRCFKSRHGYKSDDEIQNLLPTSWTYQRGFAEFWCLPKDYGYQNYILQLDCKTNKNIFINVLNTEQYEIILVPGSLRIKKIIDYQFVKYLICEFKPYTLSEMIGLYFPDQSS